MQDHMRRWVRQWPWLRRPARALYRQGRFWQARALGRLRQDALRPLYVDPLAITKSIARDDPALTGSGLAHLGTVAGGDWDLRGVPVSEHDGVYNILRAREVDGRDWHDIPAYRANLARIAAGQIVDSAATAAEYEARWAKTEALYKQIAAEGYLSQAELAGEAGNEAAGAINEVRVQIGRRGELLFEEGLHRLAIAQLLELPQIPVLVTRRHAQWAGLRDAVIKIVAQRGFFHQPFDHPDLDCLNDWYGSELAHTAVYGDERWPVLRDAALGLDYTAATVLDIGAYFGAFCHHFEEAGFSCTAVEPDPVNLDVLRRWRLIKGKTFAVRDCSIFDLEETHFDIVLALNVFHHFVRTREDYERLTVFLQRLECGALFFEPDSNAGIAGAYRQFDDEAFIAFVLEHSGLQEAQLLGRAREGRNVYLLT
jgi:hypothetical protein